jgi:hypothetical protein
LVNEKGGKSKIQKKTLLVKILKFFVLKVENPDFLPNFKANFQIFNSGWRAMGEMVVRCAQLTSGGHCDTRVTPNDIINVVVTRCVNVVNMLFHQNEG